MKYIFPIADDITVARCCATKKEALKDNNAKLGRMYERYIILNQEKGEID